MASSSHYHYHKDDDDDFDNIFDDVLDDPNLFPEPKERKTYFYREKPGRRPQEPVE